MMTLSTILGRKTTTQGVAEVRRRSVRGGLGLLVMLFGLVGSRTAFADGTYLPVIVADFNHDGIPDVLIPSNNSPTATVSLGTLPGGSFNGTSRAVTLPAVCTQTAQGSMVVGDFNGDGLSDIAFFCGASGGVGGVLLSNGDGTFATARTLAGVYSTSGVVGDFDHDGKLDLAVLGPNSASSTTQGIQFFHGNGDGTFAPAVFTTFAAGSAYSFPVAVDVNSDGYADIALGSFTTGAPTLNIFGNNKDGTFGTLAQGVASASVSAAVGTAGVSNDGAILVGNFFGVSGNDFAVPDTGTPGIFVIKNTSSGTTYSLGTAVLTPFPALRAAGVGSFTGSGFSDLAGADGTNLTVLVNDGAGNFSANYASLSFGSAADTFAVADANGDGYADIYTAAGDSVSLSTTVNLVNGSATATSQPVSLTSIGTKNISATWTGDVNFTGATTSGTQTVNGSPAALTLTSSASPSRAGDAVTFTVVARAVQGTVLPTGTISLMDGTTTIASGTLDGTGAFSFTTNSLAVGTHSIQALYVGDTYFTGASSNLLSQVVNQATLIVPTVNWNIPDPITYGTALSATQLDATASDGSGVAVPGTFAYTPAAGTILDAGVRTLSAMFTPTDGTTYSTATQTVSIMVLGGTSSTTLALTSASGPGTTVVSGSVVTLTATVTSGTSPVTTGLVMFCDASAAFCTDIHLLGSAQLTSAGTATFRYVPGVGARSYKAVFAGTRDSASSSSAASPLIVTAAYPTSTTLTKSGSVSDYSLTATIVGSGGAGQPSGTVSFLDTTSGNVSIASATLGAAQTGVAFTVPGSSPATGREPAFVAVGDFNGDGKPDMAVSNYGTVGYPATGRSLSILLGNGDGTFTPAASPATGDAPYTIAVADFNGDGKVDLVVANQGSETLTVLLGHGDGTFTSAPDVALTMNPAAVATGDFNADGRADLAVAGADGSLSILLGVGDGTFTVGVRGQVRENPSSLAIGDFNGDGKADLASSNGDSTVSVLLGQGDGTFTAAPNLAVPGSTGLFNMVQLADFNGDGKLDIAASSGAAANTSAIVTVFLGNGDGTFSAGYSTAPDNQSTNGYSFGIGDFNGDGRPDLVTGDASVTLFANNGDGTFTSGATAEGATSGPDYVAIGVGDFNGDGVPDVALANSDLDKALIYLTARTETVTVTAIGVSAIGAGTHEVVASYAGDSGYGSSVSAPVALTGLVLTPTLRWTPAVTSVVYGMALGAQELDAVAIDITGAPLAGTFAYSPAAGTVLGVGTQTLSVTFTPSDTRYASATSSVTLVVSKATPALTWAAPAAIPYGTALSGAQLNASVTGGLAGTFAYNPAAGVVLAPGTQTLNVTFTPADSVDYTTATASVTIVVSPLTLTSFTPNVARVGDPNTTVTLTGSGFVTSSVVLVNGAAVATTYVNATTLTAVVPATDLAKVATLQVVVSDPSISAVTAALTLTVTPATPAVTLTGPATTSPGSQPAVSFAITNPYPVPLTASFNLLFSAAVTPAVDDPAIQFANGGRNFTFTVPANSVTTPAVQLQAGTVAGTITVPLTLTAQGVDVTPANLPPVTIVVPKAIPTVSTTTVKRSGTQLSVAIHGYSNTREVTTATFHFTAAAGATINTPDVTAPVGPLFTTWFDSATSVPYGSTFTYTQVFDVSDDAANIGSVQVTLTNSVGVSTSQTAQ